MKKAPRFCPLLHPGITRTEQEVAAGQTRGRRRRLCRSDKIEREEVENSSLISQEYLRVPQLH